MRSPILHLLPLPLTFHLRYDKYPQMREMTHLKESLIANNATPPYYLKVVGDSGASIGAFHLPSARLFLETELK